MFSVNNVNKVIPGKNLFVSDRSLACDVDNIKFVLLTNRDFHSTKKRACSPVGASVNVIASNRTTPTAMAVDGLVLKTRKVIGQFI